MSQEDHFGSGGGFSAQFKAPDYQAAAIAAYYKNVDPSTLPDSNLAPWRHCYHYPG